MKKLVVSMLLVLLLVTGCGKTPTLKNGEDAVVDLKEGAISVDDLYQEMKSKYALNVLLDMIDTKILNEKYESNADEEKYVTQMVEQTSLYYEYVYKSQYSSYAEFILAQYGVSTEEGLKNVIRLSYRRNLVAKEYAKTLVSNSEINKYYDTDIVGDMKVSHILITVDAKDDATDEEKATAKENAYNKAKELITKLDEGSDFAELAKENSKDSSASNGGDIGYFNDGDNEEAFFEAAKKLKVGEYTKEPVETKYGYHIIKLTDKKDKVALDEVKDKITTTLADKKIEEDSKISTKALIELRKKSNVSFEDKDLNTQYNNFLYNNQ